MFPCLLLRDFLCRYADKTRQVFLARDQIDKNLSFAILRVSYVMARIFTNSEVGRGLKIANYIFARRNCFRFK